MRQVEIDDELLFIPKGWDKFVFRGWVYRMIFGVLVRGEQFKGGDHAADL